MIIDKLLVSVGSTNFDNRAFRLNDEAILNGYDATFSERQTGIFEDGIKHAHQVTYEAWATRPRKEKLTERLAPLLGSPL